MMKILSVICAILVGMVSGSSAYAKTYSWTDENGVQHMSDNPPEDVHNYELAELFVTKGLYDKAITYLEQALRSKPKNKTYKAALADCYEKSGQLAAAMHTYKELADLETDSAAKASIYSRVGTMHLKLGESKEALHYLEKAAAQHPKNPDILYDLAAAYDALSKKTEAIDTLEKALKLNPEHLNALEFLGNLYFEHEKDYRTAIKYLTTTTQLDPKRFNARVRLGTCYFKLGNRIEGVRVWESVLKEDPRNTSALFGLGSFYAENGQYDEAVGIYHQLVKLNPALAKELQAVIGRGRTSP